MMKRCIYSLFALFLIGTVSCSHSPDREAGPKDGSEPEIVVRRRDDGSLSSVNQVDEEGRVNGVRVTYYPDGKTIYSKNTFIYGVKEGPSIRYYNNGQIFEYTSYVDGKRDGLARKYYKNGMLLSECEFENGIVLPGLKEYNEDGTRVTSYPEVYFREIDQLSSRNRIDLVVYSPEKNRGIKYFLLDQGDGGNGRTYLISEKSSATLQFYVKPGEVIDRQIELIAEIPTELGNVLSKRLTYHLRKANSNFNVKNK